MSEPIYDTIGKSYDSSRHADSAIVARIIHHLSPLETGHYLDVGCGSGNYTQALWQRGVRVTGVDISTQMLDKARKKNPQISWIQGDAKMLPFPPHTFDGAISTLATHHIAAIDIAFREVFRVLRGGRFVIFTSFPEAMKEWWLVEYFPKMMARGCEVMASEERLSHALEDAGFGNIHVDPFTITNSLEDWFIHAGKYRPEIYLDPAIRANMSNFAVADNHNEIEQGCARLREDIASGAINDIIRSYEPGAGDYAFVIAEKQQT